MLPVRALRCLHYTCLYLVIKIKHNTEQSEVGLRYSFTQATKIKGYIIFVSQPEFSLSLFHSYTKSDYQSILLSEEFYRGSKTFYFLLTKFAYAKRYPLGQRGAKCGLSVNPLRVQQFAQVGEPAQRNCFTATHGQAACMTTSRYFLLHTIFKYFM